MSLPPWAGIALYSNIRVRAAANGPAGGEGTMLFLLGWWLRKKRTIKEQEDKPTDS
jgi:hypothetical protein